MATCMAPSCNKSPTYCRAKELSKVLDKIISLFLRNGRISSNCTEIESESHRFHKVVGARSTMDQHGKNASPTRGFSQPTDAAAHANLASQTLSVPQYRLLLASAPRALLKAIGVAEREGSGLQD